MLVVAKNDYIVTGLDQRFVLQDVISNRNISFQDFPMRRTKKLMETMLIGDMLASLETDHDSAQNGQSDGTGNNLEQTTDCQLYYPTLRDLVLIQGRSWEFRDRPWMGDMDGKEQLIQLPNSRSNSSRLVYGK